VLETQFFGDRLDFGGNERFGGVWVNDASRALYFIFELLEGEFDSRPILVFAGARIAVRRPRFVTIRERFVGAIWPIRVRGRPWTSALLCVSSTSAVQLVAQRSFWW
jgi:hypothetical protein